MATKRSWVIIFAGLFFLCAEPPLFAGDVQFLSPSLDKEIIGKRPEFKWRYTAGAPPENVMVLIDGADVTELVSCKEGVCTFSPVQPLSAGEHAIEFSWEGENGQPGYESFSFSSRQSKLFREAYSSNSGGLNYQMSLQKDDAPNEPNSRVDGSIRTENRLSTRHWTFTASGQIRYIDQDHPVQLPEQKGFDVINFLLESVYEKGGFKLDSQLGDIIVTESENTINNYARRGGQIFLNYRNLVLHLFSANTAQYYGLNGGLGLNIDPNDKIYGVSGGVTFWNDHVTLRSLWAKGGEEGSSFGISTVSERQRGEVAGFMLDSNWFDSRMNIRGEYDITEYDSSSQDEFGYESDKAYKAVLSWDAASYGFSGIYEYMGPDYEVIGNQGLPKNRQGFSLSSWFSLTDHRLEFLFSRYNDNVEDDDLYPTVYDYQAGVRYSFNRFPNLPVSLSYQKTIQNSTDEPEYTPAVYFDTDAVGADVSWLTGSWNFNLHAGYSYQNDKEHMSGDTATITVTFAPGFTGTYFRINPSLSYNKSISHLTNVETDTYMANWDMEWQITDRILWSVAGNYNLTKADDDSVDQQNLDVHSRIAYRLFRDWLHLVQEPSIGLRGRYSWQDDRVYGNSEDSFVLMVDFTTSLTLAF